MNHEYRCSLCCVYITDAGYRYVKTERVANTMLAVDRGLFSRYNPYADSPQSIGYGATISAPHMVLFTACSPDIMAPIILKAGQWRHKARARGVLSPLKCHLAPTVKHTGQESEVGLCEIFKFWSFLRSKSVSNACKLLKLLGDFATGHHWGIAVPQTP